MPVAWRGAWRWSVVALAAGISGCAAPETDTRGASTSAGTQPATQTSRGPAESVSIEPHKSIKAMRYYAPRLVYRAEGAFIAEVPPAWNALVERGESPLTVRVVVEQGETRREGTIGFPLPRRAEEEDGADGAATSTRPASQPATAPSTGTAATGAATVPTTSSQPARRRREVLYRGEVSIDLAGLKDGEARATFTASTTPAGARGDAVTQTFEIIREKVARVAPAHRDELAVWLDDHNANRAIWGKVPTWRNLAGAIERGASGDPYGETRGFLLRSYESALLRRRQPYTMYVPQALDLGAPSPLLIVLHGSGGDYRNIIADHFAGQRFEKAPMLIANAGAYRHQEFRHMALDDVRSVLEDVSRKYRVDRSRVYLQGISLGGRGVLEAAALLPQEFAAVSSQGSYGITDDVLDPMASLRREPLATALGMRSDIRTWLPNLRNTQVEFVFGWNDHTTLAANPLLLSRAMRQMGMKPVERGFDTGHDISLPLYDWTSTREWMLRHKRPDTPALVHHRVSNLRFGRAHWITVTALREYGLVGEVMAKFDARARTVQVNAFNVGNMVLEAPCDVETLIVNGNRRTLPEVVTKGGAFPIIMDEAALAGSKTSGQSGPLWDVFSTPVIYAYAGAREEKEARRLQRSAERSADWDMSWGSEILPVKAASELTDEDRKTSSVILFVSGASDRVDGIDEPSLPAGVSGNIAVAMRPSPWAKDRYVVVVRTDTTRSFSLHDLGWWDQGLQSDWIVANARSEVTGRRRERIEFVAAGCYDGSWRASHLTRQDYRREMMLGPGASGD